MFEVANQSCQISVIRSTSGREVRTILSSHQRWSSPNASFGASGRPLFSGRLADERVDLRRVDERVDGVVKPLGREMLGLPAPRAEARAPQKPLGLVGSERARVHREW